MKRVCAVMMVLCLASCVWALGLSPLPEEDGLDGSVTVGAAWMNVKSNSWAGSSFNILSDRNITAIANGPDGESSVSPLFGLSLRYTLAAAQTQVFLDSVSFSPMPFDRAQSAGIRRQLDDDSIFEGAALFNISRTEVWTDPFVTGSNRDETERTSTGLRLAWGRMFGTGLHVSYNYREIDIDHETSGQALGLSAANQRLLNRNGTHHQVEVMYIHPLAENQWIAPTVRYDRYDLDGKAMASDGGQFAVTYIYAGKAFTLITNLSAGIADYDRMHPVFGKTRSDVSYGISTGVVLPKLFERDNLAGTVGIGYWHQNSDIAFYDEEILTVTAGTTLTF